MQKSIYIFMKQLNKTLIQDMSEELSKTTS